MQRPTIGMTTTMDLKTEAQYRQEMATCWQLIEQAQAYDAAQRKDAERYRWLRAAGARMGALNWDALNIFQHDLAALDCMIDASIALRRDGAA